MRKFSRSWVALALLAVADRSFAAPHPDEECCWCGKPYIRDRSAQTTALDALESSQTSEDGGSLNVEDKTETFAENMVIRGVLGPADVRPDRGFYVEGVDADAFLVVVVLHPPVDRQLVVTLALDGDKLPGEDEKFEGEHYEKIRWEVQLPSNGADTHWLKLPLKLRAGLRTRVHWTLADWPMLRHTGGGKILSKGSVAITVAESLTVAQGVGAVRVVHPPNRTAHLEVFQSGTDTPQPIFPYGFFANWGGWMGKDLSGSAITLQSTIGNVVHPVSPFDPGGLDAVETFLSVAANAGTKWEHDMRHHTADTVEIVSQIERFKSSPAILSWYISDEPDGAGNHPGAPVGVSPGQVQAAYDAAKQADPYHPVSLSLNCMESARYYAGAADIIMVDVYPIGSNFLSIICMIAFRLVYLPKVAGKRSVAAAATTATGVLTMWVTECGTLAGAQLNGVCSQLVHGMLLLTDLSRDSELLGGSRPIGSIAQAFGGEHHWTRGPTAAEFRAMSYLGLVHGAYAGLTYWLREEETDTALLEEARRIAVELERLAPVVLRGLPLPSTEEGASGGLRAVASGSKTKKGGAGIVTEDNSEGLHVAGWCNEEPHQGGGGDTEAKKGAGVSKKLELTLLLVNSGTGRRGGVRLIAPSSGRWLEATPSYARDIVSLPSSDELLSSKLTIHRSGSDSLGVDPGRLQLIDSIPLPKYGVRLYAVTIDDYVPSQANPQQDGGGCDGWLRDAVAEQEEVLETVQELKSEL